MNETYPTLGASSLTDWLKTYLQQTQTTLTQSTQACLDPGHKAKIQKKLALLREKRRNEYLQEATPEELAKITRPRLIRALTRQKLTYTVEEMAALSGLDVETIRRRVKDGTLPKVPSVRVIYVYYHHFINWLQGERKAST
jgi:response regulator of citrate/malate metabolism